MTDCSTISLTAPSFGAGFDFGSGRRLASLAGHFWTVGPALMDGLLSSTPPFGTPFSTLIYDETMGIVRLTGILDELAGADSLMLIVHGYGSNANSRQCAG